MASGSAGGRLHRQPARHPAVGVAAVDCLRLQRGLGAGRWGFFLRAETMHGFYTYLEENPAQRTKSGALPRDEPRGVVPRGPATPVRHPRLLLPRRARGSAVVHLDPEPDEHAARPGRRRRPGPLCHPLPGARVAAGRPFLEVGEWGLRETAWEDLDLVWHWRRFLDTPEAYLRHLTEG